jgi:hypothetical protein
VQDAAITSILNALSGGNPASRMILACGKAIFSSAPLHRAESLSLRNDIVSGRERLTEEILLYVLAC